MSYRLHHNASWREVFRAASGKNCMQLANFTDYAKRKDVCMHCWQAGLCCCDPATHNEWMAQEFGGKRILWNGKTWEAAK